MVKPAALVTTPLRSMTVVPSVSASSPFTVAVKAVDVDVESTAPYKMELVELALPPTVGEPA